MTAGRGVAWPALGLVMAVAAIVLLVSGDGLSFSGDEFSYYGRQILFHDFELRHFESVTPEYLLIPHNGHLQIGGKLLYEALFGIFGSDYAAFRVATVAGVLACVALFFALARRRVGDPLALLGAILLAFLGAAWEVQLWAFDMHTTLALAAGLGALLAHESKGRYADALTCALLVVACCFIEVGLVFVAAIAAAILLEPGRWRRIWVAAVPAILFVAWYVWARKYDFPGGHVDLLGLVPSIFRSTGAVAVSLTGRMPTGPETDVNVVGQTPATIALGVVLIALVVLRVWRTGFTRTLVPPLVALGVYWTMIAFSARAEDSSRYIFVGAVLVLLVVAECLRGWRPRNAALALCAVAVAVALPGNLAKLGDGSEYLQKDATLTRGELAMIELAGTRGDPDYLTISDKAAMRIGASPYIAMTSAQYLDMADERGSIAASLDEVRDANVFERSVFDTVLSDALGVGISRASEPAGGTADCSVEANGGPAVLEIPPEGVLLRATGSGPAVLGLSRFTLEHPVHGLGTIRPGEWQRLDVAGPDAAPDLWRLFTDAPLEICPL